MVSVADCSVIEFPRINDVRGSLCFAEAKRHVPFAIQRIFYLFDISVGDARGGHAHKLLHQLMIPIAGGFRITLDDGKERRPVTMEQPWRALHVPPMIWAELDQFQPGSVCLVLASDYFDEGDYLRDYKVYLTNRGYGSAGE